MLQCMSKYKEFCLILILGGLLWNLKSANVVDVFFMSEDNICRNCTPKDIFEMSKLKNYFEGDNCSNSINSIAVETGISVKNLSRYFENKEFSELSSKLNIDNMNINL